MCICMNINRLTCKILLDIYCDKHLCIISHFIFVAINRQTPIHTYVYVYINSYMPQQPSLFNLFKCISEANFIACH